MKALRITTLTALVGALLIVIAYGAGYATRHLDNRSDDHAETSAPATPSPGKGTHSPDTPGASPSAAPSDLPTSPTPSPTKKPKPPKPTLTPGPALLSSGDTGAKVRDLQARLKQIAWLSGSVSDQFNPATVEAIRGFQAKRKIPVTGEVDQRTLDRLHAMTRQPTRAELFNLAPPSASTGAPLDARCQTGRALCIDKSSRTVRWVVDGEVQQTLQVRFGASSTPTREGAFSVQSKSRYHVSSLYDSEMPFAMFFSGGQAVHYSSDFAARGYSGASHGCVNVRDRAGIEWLFDQVRVGDKVIVYWS
ncbi:L,D-transpeptidase family protein [Nocardioides sp. Bht2]|uniref:L,D-transpeptidase family protein n=1 Tax=Nocardioides sp. Bht2 TaxID=3392297 RepID=UPI0039B6CE0B